MKTQTVKNKATIEPSIKKNPAGIHNSPRAESMNAPLTSSWGTVEYTDEILVIRPAAPNEMRRLPEDGIGRTTLGLHTSARIEETEAKRNALERAPVATLFAQNSHAVLDRQLTPSRAP